MVTRLATVSNHVTMATAPVLMRVLASSVKIANRAGVLVREIMSSGDLGVKDKGGQNNVQTKADVAVEKMIRASLLGEFPELIVIGEEDEALDESADLKAGPCRAVLEKGCPAVYNDVKESEIVVWVDPLDGTKEFTQGLLDHVTILIGMAVNGKAVAGVINQPFYNYKEGPDVKQGRSIWGLVGLGAFGWNRSEPPSGRNALITTRSHSNELVNKCLEALGPSEILRQGGAGNKVLKVIEGEADAYVFASPGCKKWDTCAPEAVLLAIGGRLTDVRGENIEYHSSVKHPNTGGVIATFRDHEKVIEKIPQEVKDSLPG